MFGVVGHLRYLGIYVFVKQIFSNGNEAHVAEVLSRLGLEDCFDDIISFETLNPTQNDEVSDNDGEFMWSKLRAL